MPVWDKDMAKINRALGFIRMGNYVKPSILAVGLNYNTHRDRYNKGKKGLEPYTEYYEMFEQAKNQAEIKYVESVYDSALDGNVGAAQWYLSRTRPDRFGKKEKIDIKQNNHQVIEFVPYSEVKKKEKKKE